MKFLRSQPEYDSFVSSGFKNIGFEKKEDVYDKLMKLGELRSQGLINDEEFNKERRKLLNDQ
ncbi:SHOCT domain-containing protein [bacterium]|nr:SHOCT domain-containing protein [bacterium]